MKTFIRSAEPVESRLFFLDYNIIKNSLHIVKRYGTPVSKDTREKKIRNQNILMSDIIRVSHDHKTQVEVLQKASKRV